MEKSIKKRLHYIDIAKGLLITMLMFSHTLWWSTVLGIENYWFSSFGFYAKAWTCFFMPAFFIITGLCSNFDKSFSQFLLQNSKTLLFPAFIPLMIHFLHYRDLSETLQKLLFFLGDYWFLTALFFSKLLYWLLKKSIANNTMLFFILLILSILGVYMNSLKCYPNLYYHQHFLAFTLFIAIGNVFKKVIISDKIGKIAVALFAVSLVLLFCFNVHIPEIVSVFSIKLTEYPLFLYLSVCGTIACLSICKMIGNCQLFEYLGQNTLIIYIYHINIVSLLLSAINLSITNNDSFLMSFLQLLMIVIATLFFMWIMCSIINTRCMKWVKGDF